MRQTIAFQIVVSVLQIFAAITSLIDISRGRTAPTSFGTQHVALLLVAWAPFMVFGIALPRRYFNQPLFP
ncbi:hypothetical protein K474DRAFT_1597770 [Panus rudis PR-1116 ss-1]|nr:hypothetical protein K474DRAFT_1597770 [Panus rudis PR-1116 ss-1]